VDPRERVIISRVAQSLEALLRGETGEGPALPQGGDGQDEVQALCDVTTTLVRTFANAQDFIASLSKGVLDVDPPSRNFLISPFKQLHSNLRHLTWQTKQVAKGDLSQHVDFLGEFSDAFNSMIASLQEKRRVEEELRSVHLELLEANTRVLDSIHYARTIQAAFLPSVKEMGSQLGEHFIIWRPKDIIGGDMYKFRTVAEGCVLAVMDCTGHGVPGALMTMIAGTSFDLALEDEGYHQPSKLLERLNELIKTALNQHGKSSASNDGLDIGVCFVDKAENRVVFAGAGIGLYYLVDGTPHEVRPDRQSIGYKSSRVDYRYTDHTIPVTWDTHFYMTTDGMLHQTGGPSDLPMGKRRFKGLLAQCEGKGMAEQERLFLGAFDRYRGGQPQLDDVTLLGFVVR
jgi:phosphoserine phosphatase RsbU/P